MEVLDGFHEDLTEWGKQSTRNFPWREEPSPYEIIVAEVLLQSTFAEKVSPVYQRLIKDYPDPCSLSRAVESDLRDLLQPLGLQRRKTSWLQAIGERLCEVEIPTSYEAVIELPGIGEYGANAVLCFGFGERRPIIDTNVIRIYNRMFSLDLKNTEDDHAWEFAEAVLPLVEYEEYNLSLLDLGAEVCTSQNPSCVSCPVNEYCDYYAKACDA